MVLRMLVRFEQPVFPLTKAFIGEAYLKKGFTKIVVMENFYSVGYVEKARTKNNI